MPLSKKDFYDRLSSISYKERELIIAESPYAESIRRILFLIDDLVGFEHTARRYHEIMTPKNFASLVAAGTHAELIARGLEEMMNVDKQFGIPYGELITEKSVGIIIAAGVYAEDVGKALVVNLQT